MYVGPFLQLCLVRDFFLVSTIYVRPGVNSRANRYIFCTTEYQIGFTLISSSTRIHLH